MKRSYLVKRTSLAKKKVYCDSSKLETEKYLLVVVVELEESGATLDRGLDHGGRSDLDKATVVKVLAEGLHDLGPDLQDARGLLLAQDQVTEIVLDGGIRVLVHLVGDGLLTAGSLANNLPVVNSQLMIVGSLFQTHKRVRYWSLIYHIITFNFIPLTVLPSGSSLMTP